MILLSVVFIVLQNWFDPGWTPFSELREVQLRLAYLSFAFLVLYCWQLRRSTKLLMTAIPIGFFAALGLCFCFGPLHSAMGYFKDPTLIQGDNAGRWALAVMGGWFGLSVSMLRNGDRIQRMCIAFGAVGGLVVGRALMLALPEATYYRWPGSALWLWVPLATGILVGLDLAVLLPGLRAKRKEKLALAALGIVLAGGLALRAIDIYSGAYRCYSVPELKHSRCVPGLVAKLSHAPNIIERSDAAASLGDLQAREATAPLATVLAGNGTPIRPQVRADILADEECIRRSAAIALGYIGDDEAVTALISALDDRDESVRGAAVTALGTTRSKRAFAHLVSMLKDPSPETRFSVPKALLKTGGKAALPALISASGDAAIRNEAVYALGCLKDKRALPAVKAALSDSEWYVRDTAVTALGEIGGPEALRAVAKMLNDPDGNVRYKAAEVLKTARKRQSN